MKTDLYADTTARIVAALERGVAPWVRPWFTVPEAIPMNAQTRRPYRGVNFTLLPLEAATRGYEVNRWLTYRQALELGGQVRKAEHGVPVIFWRLRQATSAAETPPDTNAPELPDKVVPLLRAYTVFNVAQVDGLTKVEVSPPRWEPEARGKELLLMSGATLHHGGSKAYYRPGTDEIQLPPRPAFASACAYYNVALHELTHWTSHEST